MSTNKIEHPTVLIIFGAKGDLNWRKLIPAVYNLYLDKNLPDKFAVIGIDHNEMPDEAFKEKLLEGINKFSRRGKADKGAWDEFKQYLSYQQGDFTDKNAYKKLSVQLEKLDKKWSAKAIRIFYFSAPPRFFGEIARQLYEAEIANDPDKHRFVVEKPFGHDLESARRLNLKLCSMFKESQIYRIDHYLGKETVQNIMVFRFANYFFEPLWNRNFIRHIQFTVAEDDGIGTRGKYYEKAGALRDMIQNHVLQLLCLIAMEPPVSFDAEEIRDRRIDVLRAIRKIPKEEVFDETVRGQYGAGWLEGKKVKGYPEEKDVEKNSETETFAAIKFQIDNWRWKDVPFYVRTGKRLYEKETNITIQFQDVPHQIFPSGIKESLRPNLLVISIQPKMEIRLRFQGKKPGLETLLKPVDMQFNYTDSYEEEPPEAYETLLHDVMEGDATLFMRSDQVEEAWKALMPILEVWENTPPFKFPNYRAGTWGPKEADALIAKDGFYWYSSPLEGK